MFFLTHLNLAPGVIMLFFQFLKEYLKINYNSNYDAQLSKDFFEKALTIFEGTNNNSKVFGNDEITTSFNQEMKDTLESMLKLPKQNLSKGKKIYIDYTPANAQLKKINIKDYRHNNPHLTLLGELIENLAIKVVLIKSERTYDINHTKLASRCKKIQFLLENGANPNFLSLNNNTLFSEFIKSYCDLYVQTIKSGLMSQPIKETIECFIRHGANTSISINPFVPHRHPYIERNFSRWRIYSLESYIKTRIEDKKEAKELIDCIKNAKKMKKQWEKASKVEKDSSTLEKSLEQPEIASISNAILNAINHSGNVVKENTDEISLAEQQPLFTGTEPRYYSAQRPQSEPRLYPYYPPSSSNTTTVEPITYYEPVYNNVPSAPPLTQTEALTFKTTTYTEEQQGNAAVSLRPEGIYYSNGYQPDFSSVESPSRNTSQPTQTKETAQNKSGKNESWVKKTGAKHPSKDVANNNQFTSKEEKKATKRAERSCF